MYLHCPECSWQGDIESAWAVLTSISERRKPTNPKCELCGFSGDLMSWHLDPPFAVGHLALHLNDWPQLSIAFIRELRLQIAARVRYLHYKL